MLLADIYPNYAVRDLPVYVSAVAFKNAGRTYELRFKLMQIQPGSKVYVSNIGMHSDDSGPIPPGVLRELNRHRANLIENTSKRMKACGWTSNPDFPGYFVHDPEPELSTP